MVKDNKSTQIVETSTTCNCLAFALTPCLVSNFTCLMLEGIVYTTI